MYDKGNRHIYISLDFFLSTGIRLTHNRITKIKRIWEIKVKEKNGGKDYILSGKMKFRNFCGHILFEIGLGKIAEEYAEHYWIIRGIWVLEE